MIGLFCFALAVLASPCRSKLRLGSRVTASRSDWSPPISERQRPQKNERELGTLEKTSSVPGLYEEFLQRYPTTSHLFEARERLVDLRSKQVASVACVYRKLYPC